MTVRPEPPVSAEAAQSRAKRLKALTHDAHDCLDRAIMAGRPFESLERYGRFLVVQHGFHRDVHALYDDPALTALLPDMPERRRLRHIARDIEDVGAAVPLTASTPRFVAGDIDLPTALGWLYVAEGSNLGAAFLFKAAAKLGLDEARGARHLAASPEGRARQWRDFTAALDQIPLTSAEEARAVAGARAAFARVHDLVRDAYGPG